MQVLIYSIKDVVTGQFNDLKLFYNKGQAQRWFKEFCNESKFANDLQLYCLGSYNLETGEIFSHVDFELSGGVK